MRRGKEAIRRRNGGFTLFEMVVTICSIVILYMVAEQRLNELPAAAERANFFAVLEQIKTGVNFEMVTKLAGGNREAIREMEGANPMNYLLEAPSNYRGEVELVTDSVERRNSWYFETSTRELVYVVGGSSIADVAVLVAGSPIQFGQIRFQIRNFYSNERSRTNLATSPPQDEAIGGHQAQGGNWQGVILTPVREFTWERRSERPVSVD